MRGDFRIVIGGESTAPLSHQACGEDIVEDLEGLVGVGKAIVIGPSDESHVGHSVEGGTQIKHIIVVEAHTVDLDTVEVVLDMNWRGTAPRIQGTVTIRASARNAHDYGVPSQPLTINPSSTRPGTPGLSLES